MIHIRIDVFLTESRLLQVLLAHADQEGLVTISLPELAALMPCHFNTVHRTVKRLESKGRIKRLSCNTQRMTYQVLKHD